MIVGLYEFMSVIFSNDIVPRVTMEIIISPSLYTTTPNPKPNDVRYVDADADAEATNSLSFSRNGCQCQTYIHKLRYNPLSSSCGNTHASGSSFRHRVFRRVAMSL